jgi:hypothetical protein
VAAYEGTAGIAPFRCNASFRQRPGPALTHPTSQKGTVGMKFLVLLDQHGGRSAPEAVENLARESREWVQEQQRNGRIEVAYYFIEGGGFMIANVDTPEDLFDLIHGRPAPLLKPTARMILDFEPAMDRHTPYHLRNTERALGR